jgi:hypothetical protein
MINARLACFIGVILVACAVLVKPRDAIAERALPLWTPPKTSLPKSFVDAVGFTFEHGLADPTGGEFHEVTINGNQMWPDKGPKYKVTGWLMPAKGIEKAYVICWNGLPYRNFELGPKIDLAAFVKERALKGNRDGEFSRGNSEDVDANDPVTTVGMAYLLRLNRSDLAESLAPTKEHLLNQCCKDLFADIVWFRYNRAVYAYLRNDYSITKEDSRWLVENYESFQDKSQPVDFNKAWLNTYKVLLADAEGRIKIGNRFAFDPVINAGLPIKERVADIIKNLDEAKVHMWESDDPNWTGDPIYTAAMETGEPMLDALVDCLEQDQRLTRNDGNHRTLGRVHNLIPVSRLALALILNITSMKAMPRLKDGTTDFTTLRAEIKAIKGLGLAERCFTLLQMDSTSPSQWADAARMMMTPPSAPLGSRSKLLPQKDRTSKPEPIVAETFRNRTNPSLTELLAKRTLQAIPPKARTTSSQLQIPTS